YWQLDEGAALIGLKVVGPGAGRLVVLLLIALALPAQAAAEDYPQFVPDAAWFASQSPWRTKARANKLPEGVAYQPMETLSGDWSMSVANPPSGQLNPGIGYWGRSFSWYSRAVVGL